MGLRAYAYLLEKKGERDEAKQLEKIDLNFTKIWWLDSMVRSQDHYLMSKLSITMHASNTICRMV